MAAFLRGAGAALEKAICRSLTREADGKPDVASSHAAHRVITGIAEPIRRFRECCVPSDRNRRVERSALRVSLNSCFLRGDSALHPSFNRGLLQRAAERETATERTSMPTNSLSPTDSQTSGPRLCPHRACRRTGICHAQKLMRLCLSPASREAKSPLTEKELNAKMKLLTAETRLVTQLINNWRKVQGNRRPRPRP